MKFLLSTEIVFAFPSFALNCFRLQFKLHKVMYKQMSSWLLQGTLSDPYAEFFVHKVKKVKTLANASNQDDEIGIGGITGQQLQQIQVCFVLSDGSRE